MSRTTSFIIGGLTGACLALLFAPNAGQDSRAKVAETAQAKWQEAVDAGRIPVACQAAAESAIAQGQALYAKAGAFAREAAEGAKPVITEHSDDLREKIEAARQRIAAQVIQNAETATASVAEEEIEVEVEVVPAGESQAAAEQAAKEAAQEAAQESAQAAE